MTCACTHNTDCQEAQRLRIAIHVADAAYVQDKTDANYQAVRRAYHAYHSHHLAAARARRKQETTK